MSNKTKLRQAFAEIRQLSGDATERFVQENLQKALDDKKLPPWFLGFQRTKKWSAEDRHGVDFIIRTTKGDIRVDVKSSRSYAIISERQHKQHGDEDRVVLNVNILEKPEVFLGRFITATGGVWRRRV